MDGHVSHQIPGWVGLFPDYSGEGMELYHRNISGSLGVQMRDCFQSGPRADRTAYGSDWKGMESDHELLQCPQPRLRSVGLLLRHRQAWLLCHLAYCASGKTKVKWDFRQVHRGSELFLSLVKTTVGTSTPWFGPILLKQTSLVLGPSLRFHSLLWNLFIGGFMLQLLLLSRFSRVRLCATSQTEAHQAPPSLGFSRQEHWSGLPFPSPMHKSEKWKWSLSVMSDCSWRHGLQPTRLFRPWDFPGKSTGVGCHCLLQGGFMNHCQITCQGMIQAGNFLFRCIADVTPGQNLNIQ